MESEEDKERRGASSSPGLDAKDYAAIVLAMAETTLLPLILLAIVLTVFGIAVSVLFFGH